MRRGRHEIYAGILATATEDYVTAYKFCFAVELSWWQIKEHVPLLLKQGLLEQKGRTYKATEKGRLFVELYKQLQL